MRKFDIVTFLLALAGKIALKRHEKLVQREANLKASIEFAQRALQETVSHRFSAAYLHQDIKQALNT